MSEFVEGMCHKGPLHGEWHLGEVPADSYSSGTYRWSKAWRCWGWEPADGGEVSAPLAPVHPVP